MPATIFRNRILRTLGTRSIDQLRLTPFQIAVGQDVQVAGAPIANLFFPETGMASLTASFSDGSQVDVGMFGYDSIIGTPALMGATHSLHRVYGQIAGHGYVSPLKAAIQEFRTCGEFHLLTLRHVQAQLVEARQFAACYARHGVEERLASCLLLCSDRTQTVTFPLSHEFLAYRLGSTRSTVSLVAAALKSKGLINYSRGTMEILNPAGLELRTCECYAILKDHFAIATDLEKAYSA